MRLALICLLVAGCGDDTGVTDMSMDLSTPDVAVPADMTPVFDPDSGMCAPGGMTHAKMVIDTLVLPQQRADFSMDLNGDNRNDNQFGNIVGALTGAGLDSQASLDAQLAAGNDIMLLDVESADPLFDADSCSATTFYNGVSQAAPDFDGGTTFTIDTALGSTFFSGPITSAKFSSQPLPQAQTVPEKLTIKLPILGLTPVTLWGAHIQWKYAGGKLIQGQINGAMTKDDVQKVVVPAVAMSLTQKIQSDPSSSTSMQIEQLFDVGDGNGGSCMNPDGSSSAPNDHLIGTCEVAGNSIIKNVLAPDVQMFQGGVYKPSAANTMKDSVSVGLGFTAVAAGF